MGYIYTIVNLKNGKHYVGKTTLTISERFKEHLKASNLEENQNRPLYSAIKKYGKENFVIEELEQVKDDLLSEREIHWIKTLHTYGHSGYNATEGGDGKLKYNDSEPFVKLWNDGKSISEISEMLNCGRDTVSRILKNENINIPRDGAKSVYQCDRITCEIIRVFQSARKAAEFLIECEQSNSPLSSIASGIAQACRKENGISHGYRWKYVEERNNKQIEKIQNQTYKKVNQYDLDGNLLNTFMSISDGCRWLQNNGFESKQIKTLSSGITTCCKGNQKTAYNYIWKYA